MTTSSTLVFMVTRGLPFLVQDQAAKAPGLFLNIGPDVRTRQGFRPGVGKFQPEPKAARRLFL